VKVVRGGTGVIKRLSAAVVVNHQSTTDARGKVVTTPLTEQQIAQMTALVRETIGFNKDRGDSVNLMNAPFTMEKVTLTELPLWKQPELQDLARSFAWPVGTLLFAILVLLGMIRPALKSMAQSQPRTAGGARNSLNAVLSDETERPQLTLPAKKVEPQGPTVEELRLEDARKLTRDNPAAVANIIKSWVNGDSGG
jgi:flagellar M-ring protein FliF